MPFRYFHSRLSSPANGSLMKKQQNMYGSKIERRGTLRHHGVLALEHDLSTGWLIDPPIGPLTRPPGGPLVGSLPSSLAAPTGRQTGLSIGSLVGSLLAASTGELSGSPD